MRSRPHVPMASGNLCQSYAESDDLLPISRLQGHSISRGLPHAREGVVCADLSLPSLSASNFQVLQPMNGSDLLLPHVRFDDRMVSIPVKR